MDREITTKKEREMKNYLVLFLFLTLSACTNSDKYMSDGGTSVVIELPGDEYYPDGIAARKDGTLFVASMWTGQIDKIASNTKRPVSFIPPEANKRTALGLLVDEKANRLWVCYWDFHRFMKIPAQLKSFDLNTGNLIATYNYPTGTIGNDLTMDGNGNIYTTCSFTHKIYRLRAGGNRLEVWCDDLELAKGWVKGFSLNGITWDGNSFIYLTRTDNDGFYRVSIKDNGSAGVVQKITVADKQTNIGYDGIVALDSDTFLVAEFGSNRLTMIKVSDNKGTKQIITTGLDIPTNLAVVDDGVWVVESQLNHMLGLDKTPPKVPFLIKYVPLSSN